MEIFEKYKCIEYGKNDKGLLFLTEHCGGFVAKDTPENRRCMEEDFNKWKKATKRTKCDMCQYKEECVDYQKAECNMKKVKVTMYFEVNENDIEEIKKLENHVEYLLNLEEYPEIESVYGVKVEEA